MYSWGALLAMNITPVGFRLLCVEMTEVEKLTLGSSASRVWARVSPAIPAAVTTDWYAGSFLRAKARASCKVKRSGAPGTGAVADTACFGLATASGFGAAASGCWPAHTFR